MRRAIFSILVLMIGVGLIACEKDCPTSADVSQREMQLEATIVEHEGTIARLEGSVARLEGNVADREATISDLQDKLADIDDDIAALNRSISDKTDEIERLKDDISDRDGKIVQLEEQLADLLAPEPQPSPTPTPGPSPSPTPEPLGDPIAELIMSGLELLEGPSMDYSVVSILQVGEQLYLLGQYDDCNWLNVTTAGREASGWILRQNVFLKYLGALSACGSIPDGTFRPFTGVIESELSGGSGDFYIQNDLTTDALVVVRKTGPVDDHLLIYVRSGDAIEVKKIKDGSYEMYYATGSEWNDAELRFTRNVDYRYHWCGFTYSSTAASSCAQWDVTLKEINGVIPGVQIEASQFPDIVD